MARTAAKKNKTTQEIRKVRCRTKAKKEATYMSVYLPANLDLEKLLRENPPNFKYGPSKFNDLIDNFKYLINLITQIPLHNRDVIKNTGFVPCDSKEMEKWVHHHSPYLEYLIQHEILETDYHYEVGKGEAKGEAIGYRFTAQYASDIKSDSIRKNSILKRYKEQIDKQDKDRARYSYLSQWFNPHLSMDLDGAKKHLLEELKNNLRTGDTEVAWHKYQYALVAAEKIARGEWSFSVDPTAGRINTNLTNLPKSLRHFITYKGMTLSAVDIKTSQPCFSGILFDPDFYREKDSQGRNRRRKVRLNSEDFMDANINKYDEAIFRARTTLMFVNLEGGGKDIQKYREIIQGGTLYEFIQNEIFLKTGKYIPRDDIKVLVLMAIYSRNRLFGCAGDKYKLLFKELFPAVYELFKAIKTPAHNILAILLQSIEARVMLDHVAKRIHLERPDMPIFTIHDSIACPVGNEDYVARVIKEEMMKLTGMRPSAKYEYWCPSNLQPKTDGIAETKRAGQAA